MEENLNILLAQATYINNRLSATHPAKQCNLDLIGNITIMINALRNDTINPTLVPPPPLP
jgi:hypothetical protein